MSQNEESDSKPVNFHLAIERLAYVESLFNNGNLQFTHIHQELYKCYEMVESLIFDESTNSPYLVDLFQLKQLMLLLIKLIQKRITKQAAPVTKTVTKVQQNTENCVTKVQQNTENSSSTNSIIKSTIEVPRVNGLKEIAGLWDIKKTLKSLVILPRKQPQLFVNHRSCNSVLLFGPPGTGKTHLVHALASEANAVLHSVSFSTMLSPFIGQTEKNVQTLFEHLRSVEEFSILFIDEVDGFCRTRHDSEQDHSRRMKTELMCQMSKMEDMKNIFLICATNCPWDLDTAFLRRFHKRIYVPLPNVAERNELLHLFVKNTPLEVWSEHWELLSKETEGFSGSDISDLVQTALNLPITELEDTKIWKYTIKGFYEPVVNPEDFNLENVVYSEMSDLPNGSVQPRPAQMLDLLNSLDGVKATVPSASLKRYEDFISK